MAYPPFPGTQPGSDNADDVSRIQILILAIKIHAISRNPISRWLQMDFS
jgi:hypothetical protein